MIRPTAIAFCLLFALPAFAVERFDETRAVDADARIEIENRQGLIRVDTWERDEVVIEASLGKGARGVQVEGDRRRLSIRIDYPERGGGWFGGGAAGDSELRVKLPAGATLKVSSVSAKVEVAGPAGQRVEIGTVSGDVRYRGTAAVLELATVSGDARIEGGAREVSLQSVSGDVALRADVSDRLRAESVSGDLDLRSATALKQVQANVVSGDVELALSLAPGGRLTAQSLSGDVEAVLPKSTSADISASSFSGRIRSAVGTVQKERYGPGSSLSTTLGEGDGQIRLESFSGDLELRLE